MTDIGTYAAIEADVETALAAMTGVKTLMVAAGAPELLQADLEALPAVGIAVSSAARKDPPNAGQTSFRSGVVVQVAVLVEQLAGADPARAVLYPILEAVRDRLNGRMSGVFRYLWQRETIEEPVEGRIGGIADFTIDSRFGK